MMFGKCTRHFLTAALVSLAAVLSGYAQTTGSLELPGLVPAAVTDGSAVTAGPFSSTQTLRLVFGLQHPHLDEEKQFAAALHTKGSPDFMHFLTAAEWSARFSPSPQDEQAVVDWAQASGFKITQRFANRLLVDVEAPVSAIQAALGVKINSYAIAGANYFSNDRNPVVPAALADIVHSIGGLNNIQVLKSGSGIAPPVFPVYAPGPAYALGQTGRGDGDRSKLAAAQPGITNGAYDPTDIYSSEAYDVNALNALGHCCNPLGSSAPPKETSIAIVSFGSQNGSDIAGFHNAYPYLAYYFQEFSIDGTPVCCDLAGTMDLEWATATANSFGSAGNTAEVYMYDGVNASTATFTDAINHALSDGFARVLMTSWGAAEFGNGFPQSVMETLDGIFISMTVQGWTLISMSGDWGATAWAGSGCSISDAVTFPASDTWVLATGGTSLQLSPGPLFAGEAGWTGGTLGCQLNDGGSGGGSSAYFPAQAYMALPEGAMRPVPDIALNADWLSHPQNVFFNGQLTGTGGTGLAAAEMAGFYAQANAYLLYLGTVTGGCFGGSSPCAPIGQGNYYLYRVGIGGVSPAHYPFYDITSGCNNNNVTESYGLHFFCAAGGRDLVTGWGSFNFLQLAWALNTAAAGNPGAPLVTFAGPSLNRWYNTDEEVIWAVQDASANGSKPTGVAGFSQAWDADPGDVSSEATPGSGNSFYSGPQFPNANGGCIDFTGTSGCGGGAGQGWHTVYVRAWDNTGVSKAYTYGRIGYDSIPPHTTGQFTTTYPAQVTLTATDATSGVASTVYQVDGGSVKAYTAPFPVTGIGSHKVTFHSADNAGNVESTETLSFSIEPTTTAVASSVNPSQFFQGVAFTATVRSGAGTPDGTVTFFNGTAQLGIATLSGGKASLKPLTLQLGNRSITAVYSGSASFSGSTSPVFTQTVNKAGTQAALTSAPNPSTHGSLVTFTATVTGDFGGSPLSTVSFMKGTSVLGTATLNASTHQAAFSTSALPSGTAPVHAVYGGNVDFNGSTSPVVKQVVH